MQFFSGTTASLCVTWCVDFVEVERKLRLRIFGMDQEGRAAIDVGAQQAQAFIGGIPRLHHDVVQFVAQEVVDHVLVTVFDFEEVGQHAGRRAAALQRSRGEELAHRLGGVTMLGDDALPASLSCPSGWRIRPRRESR